MKNLKPYHHVKSFLGDYKVLETKIFKLEHLAYPDGYKYSLIVIDVRSGSKVLMDNHKPKGHHYHVDQDEYDYQFKSIHQLFKDFKILVKNHFGDLLWIK